MGVGGDAHRPTRDIDLLGYGSNDIATLVADFKTICAVAANDGLVFEFDSFKGKEIKEDALYRGVRLTGSAELDKAKVTFQIDVGFGDVVTPVAEVARLPSFLDLPEAELRVYPVYTVVAEKFQAMVALGIANSRIKDFYDVWVIAKKLEINGDLLAGAVKATFQNRETELSKDKLTVFEEAFATDENKQKLWAAFLSKNTLQSELSFTGLIEQLRAFLEPIYVAAEKDDRQFSKVWSAKDWIWK